MNINGYIKEYGSYTFAERGFNDVDALIFAEFSYLNLELLNLPKGSSFFIKDIPAYLLNPLSIDQMDEKYNRIMIELMIDAKRYQDVYIKYVSKIDSNDDACQFFGVTIFFEDKMYISFRGTDLTLRGWKEDLMLSFLPQIPSQHYAYEYLKEVLMLEKDKKYYCGGHSKGGNLSIYAPFKIDDETNQRLLTAYSFDGPGFYNSKIVEDIESWSHQHKIRKFMPKNALVGILLNTTLKGIIIDSTEKGALQHDPFSWKIANNGSFKLYQYRLRRSFINEYTLRRWINMMDDNDKELIVNLIFGGFDSLDISVLKLKREWFKTFRIIWAHYKSFDKKDRKRIRKLIKKLISININAWFGIMPASEKKKVA